MSSAYTVAWTTPRLGIHAISIQKTTKSWQSENTWWWSSSSSSRWWCLFVECWQSSCAACSWHKMEDNTWVQMKTLKNTSLYHTLKTGSSRRQSQGHRVSCLVFSFRGRGWGGADKWERAEKLGPNIWNKKYQIIMYMWLSSVDAEQFPTNTVHLLALILSIMAKLNQTSGNELKTLRKVGSK